MLDRLKSLFPGTAAGTAPQAPSEALSTALLLLELARSDFAFAAVEMQRIRELLGQRFGLTPEALDRLIADADARAKDCVSLHAYTDRLKDTLDAPAKRLLIEMLWHVAYADGEVDKYEEHLLRRLVDLLYIPMADYVQARELAAEAAGADHP